MKGYNIMKTPEELNVLKEEVETLKKKLAELTEDELKQVAGGETPDCGSKGPHDPHPDVH